MFLTHYPFKVYSNLTIRSCILSRDMTADFFFPLIHDHFVKNIYFNLTKTQNTDLQKSQISLSGHTDLQRHLVVTLSSPSIIK